MRVNYFQLAKVTRSETFKNDIKEFLYNLYLLQNLFIYTLPISVMIYYIHQLSYEWFVLIGERVLETSVVCKAKFFNNIKTLNLVQNADKSF